MVRWPSGGKWREWVGRYAPAEGVAIITTYAGFHLALVLTGSLGLAGYGAAIGENMGFYGWMLVRDWRSGSDNFGAVAKNLLVEFGFAEVLDSFAIRPLSTVIAVTLFGPLAGVLVGKLVADLVFYLIAITLYERRKSGLNDDPR